MKPDNVMPFPVNDNLTSQDIELDKELKRTIEEFHYVGKEVIQLAVLALNKHSRQDKLFFLKILEESMRKMDEITLTGRWS